MRIQVLNLIPPFRRSKLQTSMLAGQITPDFLETDRYLQYKPFNLSALQNQKQIRHLTNRKTAMKHLFLGMSKMKIKTYQKSDHPAPPKIHSFSVVVCWFPKLSSKTWRGRSKSPKNVIESRLESHPPMRNIQKNMV